MSQLSVNAITNAAGGNTATINGMTPTAQSLQGFRNRIINGDMRIDQRNAGASVTITNTSVLTYTVDRWAAYGSVASKFSVQQNAAAVTPPVGYTNYLGATSLSAYSVGSSEQFQLTQAIEGFNVADLGWGTASAQAVTLSFWVRSSLTGTFGGSMRNYDASRSYPYSYTISAANTWEQKTITIAGDTSGTWRTTNGVGVYVGFGLGVGATLSNTAGAWAAGNFVSATGATSVVATSGATFYITGVQLEAGSVATPFERRPYGTELSLCQRYYEIATIPTSTSLFVSYNYAAGTERFNFWQFKQTKRASPTVALGPSASWNGATATIFPGVEAVQLYNTTTAFFIGGSAGAVGITASSEL